MARAIRFQSRPLVIRDVQVVLSAIDRLAVVYADASEKNSELNGELHDTVQMLCSLWKRFLTTNGLEGIFKTEETYPLIGQSSAKDATTDIQSAIERLVASLDMAPLHDPAGYHAGWLSLVTTLQDMLDAIIQFEFSSDVVLAESDIMQSLSTLTIEVDSHRSYGQTVFMLLESKAAANRAQNARVHAERAAGRASDDRLFAHYDDYASSNEKQSKFFRKATVLLVLSAVVVPLFLHLVLPSGPELNPSNLASLVFPLVVSGGIFGIAGYCARQAHLHRTLSTWSQTISIQLQTFDGFVDPIDDLSIRDGLRADFARRVFGPHPKLKGEPGVAASSPVVDSVLTRFSRDSSS